MHSDALPSRARSAAPQHCRSTSGHAGVNSARCSASPGRARRANPSIQISRVAATPSRGGEAARLVRPQPAVRPVLSAPSPAGFRRHRHPGLGGDVPGFPPAAHYTRLVAPRLARTSGAAAAMTPNGISMRRAWNGRARPFTVRWLIPWVGGIGANPILIQSY
jgi:hypothetical protein